MLPREWRETKGPQATEPGTCHLSRQSLLLISSKHARRVHYLSVWTGALQSENNFDPRRLSKTRAQRGSPPTSDFQTTLESSSIKTIDRSISSSFSCVIQNLSKTLPGPSGHPYLGLMPLVVLQEWKNHWNASRVDTSRMPGRRRCRYHATMSPSLYFSQPLSSPTIPLSLVQDASRCGLRRSFGGAGLRSSLSV
jgi:hypothetical protein